MDRSEKLKKIGFVLLGILLIALVIYSGFRFLEATVFLENEETKAVLNKYLGTMLEKPMMGMLFCKLMHQSIMFIVLQQITTIILSIARKSIYEKQQDFRHIAIF